MKNTRPSENRKGGKEEPKRADASRENDDETPALFLSHHDDRIGHAIAPGSMPAIGISRDVAHEKEERHPAEEGLPHRQLPNRWPLRSGAAGTYLDVERVLAERGSGKPQRKDDAGQPKNLDRICEIYTGRPVTERRLHQRRKKQERADISQKSEQAPPHSGIDQRLCRRFGDWDATRHTTPLPPPRTSSDPAAEQIRAPCTPGIPA